MHKLIITLCFLAFINENIFCQNDTIVMQDTVKQANDVHIKVWYDSENDQILFDRELKWWLYDQNGIISATGTSSGHLLWSRKDGTYYLFFEKPKIDENGTLDFQNLPNPVYIIVLARKK